ncbi:hypothetical protein K438DRAFT_1763507 [Mycena galopus ATCC 62051]|nr:hypothetical protein K438DRAFT_1763507 [Mycena galopus ATCC 62051]
MSRQPHTKSHDPRSRPPTNDYYRSDRPGPNEPHHQLERRMPPMASHQRNPVGSRSGVLPPGASLSGSEYEAGQVICEVCGRGVFFRDDGGAFTLKHWEAHRLTCSPQHRAQIPPQYPSAHNQPAYIPPSSYAGPSSSSLEISNAYAQRNPPIKRRRAKRTEEERIDYLRSDPHVAEFEPYRVLCAGCNKWIKLRPNSTYCSIPWDAHRKICVEKRM